jgi:mannan endo-1,4-beta-mannosidase
MTTMLRIIALSLLLCCAAQAQEPATNFITRRGDQLFDGERPFRFISFNIPNLLVIEDAYEFTRPNPWRWPNEFEIDDALESVRQMGGQVARTYVISVKREGSDMGDVVHVRAPGEFNEEGFRAIDKLVEVARCKDIRVIIPLVDQHKWWGGIGEYAAFRGKPAEAFWTDRQLIDDFKKTIRHLITRRNTHTGVVYRDEPAIFGWETGNEIEPPPEWTREIAAYIKQLAPNHVVIDGRSLHGVPLTSLDDSNVDVITTHHYPWGEDHDFSKPIRAAHALTKGKKPYFVGEFGFVETPQIAAAIQTVIDDGISGALLWSLRMHRRDGGFYWHMEVGTGRNIYKAFHWPGFESGDRYDERAVMQLMRAKAHEIRGLKPPAIETPAAPKLLPIERVSAISWQGSAGAQSYNVWRTEKANGPWRKIAEAVSDADVQYRPLHNDDGAAPGTKYWYAVSARNEAGVSKRSNVVGPVHVDCRTLVDECRDVSLLDAIEGDVSIATENARTVQEDCHRLAMRPGAAVVYRVKGPISKVRIYSFARNANANLEVTLSDDGRHFQPLMTNRQTFESEQTVYGYLTPALFEAQGDNRGSYVRIALHEAKRNETTPESADGDSDEPPIEISRIEIAYDHVDKSTLREDSNATHRGTPVNGSIFIESGQPLSATLRTIDQVAERGDRRLNVVVTILVDLTDDLRIKSYGGYDRRSGRYRPFDAAMHARLRDELRQVFTRMREHNMAIFVLPHIDSGGSVRTWRNWVDFDPLEEHGGYSYDKLMIETIADALAEAAGDETHIEMALSGEMGTSLARYPESYQKIVQRLRERGNLKQLKIGISLNHNDIFGGNGPTQSDGIKLSNTQREELQSLINECDFIGMSFYRPVSVRPAANDFVRGINEFMSEVEAHALAVPTTKPLHFSEVGIGGGHEDDDVAPDPSKAVETPWSGSGDPRTNPWRNSAMRELRRTYHAALLEFLSQQPARWHVSAAFFWSTGSWDPQGLRHPEFADREISASITVHNRPSSGY